MLRVAPILELRIVMALGPAESSNPVSEGGSPPVRQGIPSSILICPMSVYITWTGAPGRTTDCVTGSRRARISPTVETAAIAASGTAAAVTLRSRVLVTDRPSPPAHGISRPIMKLLFAVYRCGK